jgi:transposase|tara:strand:- start:959 stop:1336 length:378 start_codon:yes stop_codon:yes gene_type:complete
MPKKVELKSPRLFSEEIKKEVVKEIELGNLTVIQAARLYDIKSNQTVYRWIYKYSRTLKKSTRLVMEKDSIDFKLKQLEEKTRQLEAALGRKQLELDIYKQMVDLASKDLAIDLKKNFGEQASKK